MISPDGAQIRQTDGEGHQYFRIFARDFSSAPGLVLDSKTVTSSLPFTFALLGRVERVTRAHQTTEKKLTPHGATHAWKARRRAQNTSARNMKNARKLG